MTVRTTRLIRRAVSSGFQRSSPTAPKQTKPASWTGFSCIGTGGVEPPRAFTQRCLRPSRAQLDARNGLCLVWTSRQGPREPGRLLFGGTRMQVAPGGCEGAVDHHRLVVTRSTDWRPVVAPL